MSCAIRVGQRTSTSIELICKLVTHIVVTSVMIRKFPIKALSLLVLIE